MFSSILRISHCFLLLLIKLIYIKKKKAQACTIQFVDHGCGACSDVDASCCCWFSALLLLMLKCASFLIWLQARSKPALYLLSPSWLLRVGGVKPLWVARRVQVPKSVPDRALPGQLCQLDHDTSCSLLARQPNYCLVTAQVCRSKWKMPNPPWAGSLSWQIAEWLCWKRQRG